MLLRCCNRRIGKKFIQVVGCHEKLRGGFGWSDHEEFISHYGFSTQSLRDTSPFLGTEKMHNSWDFRWFQRARPACISWTMTQGLSLRHQDGSWLNLLALQEMLIFQKHKKKLHSHTVAGVLFRFKSNWMLNMPYNIDNRLEVASGNIWLENVFIVFWSLWFVPRVLASEIKKAQYEILQNSDHPQYHQWFLGYAWLWHPSQ